MVLTPGGREIPYGFQQPLIAPMTPHQDGTKQGRRYNHNNHRRTGRHFTGGAEKICPETNNFH